MKGLFHYLPPFAPDDSGAVSVLYELGGLVVVMDAGGCTGNICGFDEPRWHTQGSALYSAGIRDIDAIMGRDDRLIRKIGAALQAVSCSFVALVGTPVPSVIGTDYTGLKHLLEKKYGLPVLAVETTGMEYYDRGEEKAYRSLVETALKQNGEMRDAGGKTPAAGAARTEGPRDRSAVTGVWGATPLDFPGDHPETLLRTLLPAYEQTELRCYGFGSGKGIPQDLGEAGRNLVVSPAGLAAAACLQDRFGTGYDVLGSGDTGNDEAAEPSVLIVHQQFLANAVRQRLNRKRSGRTDVATWFMLAQDYAGPHDTVLEGENDLQKLVQKNGYRVVAGDPLFLDAMPGFTGKFVKLPHYAVSGDLCSPQELLAGIAELEQADD